MIYKTAIYDIYARLPLRHHIPHHPGSHKYESLHTLIISKLSQSLQIPVHPLPMGLMQ